MAVVGSNAYFNLSRYSTFFITFMTPLEQFNEETKKELTEVFERTFFALGSCAAYGNSKPDSAFIDFITQKLAAHKELILKMVREKAKIRIKEELDKYVGQLNHEEIAKIISAKL